MGTLPSIKTHTGLRCTGEAHPPHGVAPKDHPLALTHLHKSAKHPLKALQAILGN